MSTLKLRMSIVHIERAMPAIRDAIRELRTVPDGILDADIAAEIHALENEIDRLKMLRDEFKEYYKQSRTNVRS